LALALPNIPDSFDADDTNPKSLVERNPNQIQWCKDAGYDNCQLQQ
jgi:hypothetical protein